MIDFIKRVFGLIVPYWKTKSSILSWVLLISVLFLTAAVVYLNKLFNNWYNEFYNTMQAVDESGFKRCLVLFAVLACFWVLSNSCKSFFTQIFEIRWRHWMTRSFMARWLKNATFYRQQFAKTHSDNPDQRISQDLDEFISLSISLVFSIGQSIAMLFTFVYTLWELSSSTFFVLLAEYDTLPEGNAELISFGQDLLVHSHHLPDGYLVYLSLAYTLLGTLLTFIIGRPLIRLNFYQQKLEADFRFALMRIRENAESIAIYHGSSDEWNYLDGRFKKVVRNFVSLVSRTFGLNFFVFAYNQTAVIFPLMIAAPLYFAKVITLGIFMQISNAFSQVHDSLSTLISNFTGIARWKSVVDRLITYEKSMEEAERISCIDPEKGQDSELHVSFSEITSPAGAELLRDTSFTIGSGTSLLVRGPSGCGKSTLLRSIAGIWPFAKGQITYPAEGGVLFLSQKPYLPLGTIADIVSSPGEKKADADEIRKVLEEVGLPSLKDHLDDDQMWGQVLSLGEQQRLAFARVFVTRPSAVFLDEATSALDEDNEERLYSLLKEKLSGAVIVSVGHRSTLRKFHNATLTAEGNGIWKLERQQGKA